MKKLGYKVYDFQAASSRYERDFPLWLEAARLRSEGRPYNQSDYDKVIGDYNALVGSPTCFFDHDFVKLYSNVKVILVTHPSDSNTTADLHKMVEPGLRSRLDRVYYGNLRHFLKLACDVKLDHQLIRETVREKNLLEIHNLIAWVPLCKFLGVPIPDGSAPELHDNTVKTELAAHPRRAVSKMLRNGGRIVYTTMKSASIIIAVTFIALLSVYCGILALLQGLSASLYVLKYLAAYSTIRGVMRLHAIGAVLAALVGGSVAGYLLGRRPSSGTITTTSSPREQQQKFRYNHNKGKQGRGRQSGKDENSRPERPTLPSWSSVQEDIRKADAEMYKEGKAISEEWRHGKHVTFNVTHKLTESGQQLSSGPRKVLSVTEETVE